MQLSNNQLKEYIKLEQKKYRNINQEYLIYGKHLVTSALQTDLIKCIISTDENFKQNNNIKSIDYYIISKKDMAKFKALKKTPEIIAVCSQKEKQKINYINHSENILGLNNISDPGNMGTLLRTARAYGIKTILLDEQCVDIYNPKVIQSAQGVHFELNIIYTDLKKAIEKITEENEQYVTYTTFLEDNDLNKKIKNNDSDKPFILLLGNESQGLDNKFKENSDYNIKLSIEYESLNVAIAGSIIMHKLIKGEQW